MKKVLIRSLTVLLIIAAALASAVIYDRVWDKIDRAANPRDYSEYVQKYALIYGVPENIVYSVIKVESNFVSSAVSRAGAVGLMQITPDTFDWISFLLGENYEEGMLYDPETNIKYGTYLLSYLHGQFGTWETVYAAYNAGMTRVKTWQTNPEYADENGNLVNIPFKETRDYVKKVAKARETYIRLYYSE